MIVAAVLAGFADTHSAAVSVASLVAAGKFEAHDAMIPILAAMSCNVVTKIAVAVASGRRFALQIVPGLLLLIFAAWGSARLVLPV